MGTWDTARSTKISKIYEYLLILFTAVILYSEYSLSFPFARRDLFVHDSFILLDFSSGSSVFVVPATAVLDTSAENPGRGMYGWVCVWGRERGRDLTKYSYRECVLRHGRAGIVLRKSCTYTRFGMSVRIYRQWSAEHQAKRESRGPIVRSICHFYGSLSLW